MKTATHKLCEAHSPGSQKLSKRECVQARQKLEHKAKARAGAGGVIPGEVILGDEGNAASRPCSANTSLEPPGW